MSTENRKVNIRTELNKYDKAVDRMYWFFLAFILIYEILGSTYILQNIIMESFARWFQGLGPELAGMLYQTIVNLRFLIIIPAIYNIIMKTTNNKEKTFFTALLLVGWYYSFRMRDQNDTYIFRDMAMIVASYGKDYKKIFKYSIVLASGLMAVTILLFFAGIIPERTLERDGQIRHSFGTLGPTNLAGHVGFALMAYMFIKNGKLKWYVYFLIGGLSWLNLRFVDGRTSFLSVFLGSMGCIVCFVNRVKEWRIPDLLMKVWRVVLLTAYPIAVVFYLVLVVTYSPAPEIFYNKMHILYSLQGRIENANRVMGVTGIAPFGRYYENYWVRGNEFLNTGNYEFLDSSYARVLLMYGWVAFFLILGLILFVQYRLYKKKCTFQMYILAVLSLHFIMEHHILEPAYNIFLLLPFADLEKTSKQEQIFGEIR